MTRYQHFRAICSLGLPLILGNIAQISIGVVDTVMTGWYSVEALAALVLGSSFFFVVFILGAGFGHALLPLVASAAAREDAVQIRRVTRMGLWLSIIYYGRGAFAQYSAELFAYLWQIWSARTWRRRRGVGITGRASAQRAGHRALCVAALARA